MALTQNFHARSPRLLLAASCWAAALILDACSYEYAYPNEEPAAQGDREDAQPLPEFSFFVTSQRAMQQLSGNQNGFGGDLRFGETGPGAGLRGADKICAEIAEWSMPGSSRKGWRAFLSAGADTSCEPVHAIDRIGEGPWYDRIGRLVAADKADLLHSRPLGADSEIVDDLPNEEGIPNRDPYLRGSVDNHNVLTGSNDEGRLYSAAATCLDWTSTSRDAGSPRIGHSWRGASSQNHWASADDAPGCGATASPEAEVSWMQGSGEGYGAIYCFARNP